MRAVRLSKTRYIDTAFDGMGAKYNGGRWNSLGVAVVYCSESLSLATLEVLVHLEDIETIVDLYSSVPVEFDESLVEMLPNALLPVDWDNPMISPNTQAYGNRWLTENRSAVLSVPSVIIPQERNYLINPAHPDFSKIRIHREQTQRFKIDERLLKLH